MSNQSSEENEGENPVICSGEDKEAKKKRRRKKKGSGEAVTEEEKILDKPQLLDLSQVSQSVFLQSENVSCHRLFIIHVYTSTLSRTVLYTNIILLLL